MSLSATEFIVVDCGDGSKTFSFLNAECVDVPMR
jgi:hypothetical protein